MDLRSLVTQCPAQASFCASSRDAPRSTAARARSGRPRGSSFRSPDSNDNPPAAGFAGAYFVATQALELDGRLHWRARYQPIHRATAPSPRKTNSCQEESRKDPRKRRKQVCSRKRGKKTPAPTNHPIFKPPVLSGFHLAVRRTRRPWGETLPFSACLMLNPVAIPHEIPTCEATHLGYFP